MRSVTTKSIKPFTWRRIAIRQDMTDLLGGTPTREKKIIDQALVLKAMLYSDLRQETIPVAHKQKTCHGLLEGFIVVSSCSRSQHHGFDV
jgi:hypothetical protein